MDAIVLGGKSKDSNAMWVGQLAEKLSSYFSNVHVVRYKHWQSDDAQVLMDGAYERDIFEHKARSLQSPYIVVAKSIGSVLALQSIREKTINPRGLVICGLPWYDPEDTDDKILANYEKRLPVLLELNREIPTWILQNVTERFVGPDKLQERLQEMRLMNYRVERGVGNVHRYDATSVAAVAGRYAAIHSGRK